MQCKGGELRGGKTGPRSVWQWIRRMKQHGRSYGDITKEAVYGIRQCAIGQGKRTGWTKGTDSVRKMTRIT